MQHGSGHKQGINILSMISYTKPKNAIKNQHLRTGIKIRFLLTDLNLNELVEKSHNNVLKEQNYYSTK